MYICCCNLLRHLHAVDVVQFTLAQPGIKQVLSKVIWEERVTIPASENALSLRVLAVACTMRNETFTNVTEHCRTLQNVLETLWGVAERYGTL